MGKSFRHFDRNFDGSISYKEFTIVCEELDLRFTSDELKLLFKYIDDDNSGTVGYKEFINLSDEKRRGIDPFDNQMKRTRNGDFGSSASNQFGSSRGHGKRQDPEKQRATSEIMQIFEERRQLFDVEKFRGKHQNKLTEAKVEMNNCGSAKQQDYKFKKLQMKFNTDNLMRTFCSNHENGQKHENNLINLTKYKNDIIQDHNTEKEYFINDKLR